MSRQRQRDAWMATLRVSIPITSDPASLAAAQAAVQTLALPDGATVEVIAARFGRMAISRAPTPASSGSDTAAQQSGGETAALIPAGVAEHVASVTAFTPPPLASSSEPDLPVSLRRVPRPQAS